MMSLSLEISRCPSKKFVDTMIKSPTNNFHACKCSSIQQVKLMKAYPVESPYQWSRLKSRNNFQSWTCSELNRAREYNQRRRGWELPDFCLSFKRLRDPQRWKNLQVKNFGGCLLSQISNSCCSGTTIAVDIYVWLHKGAFRCLKAMMYNCSISKENCMSV